MFDASLRACPSASLCATLSVNWNPRPKKWRADCCAHQRQRPYTSTSITASSFACPNPGGLRRCSMPTLPTRFTLADGLGLPIAGGSGPVVRFRLPRSPEMTASDCCRRLDQGMDHFTLRIIQFHGNPLFRAASDVSPILIGGFQAVVDQTASPCRRQWPDSAVARRLEWPSGADYRRRHLQPVSYGCIARLR